jgi:hypothetical protein
MGNELGSRDRYFSMRKCVVLSEIWKVTKSYLLRHCRLQHRAQHPTINFLFMTYMRMCLTRLIRSTPQSSRLQRRAGGFTRLNQADLLQQEVDDVKAEARGAGVEDVDEARAFRALNLRNGQP